MDWLPMTWLPWLVPVGVALLTLGILKSVQEEWPRQGIGDTSFASLFLWLSGTVGCALWAVQAEQWLLVVLAVLPALVYLYWIIHKLHMHRRARNR